MMVSPAQVRAWALFGTVGIDGLKEALNDIAEFGAKSEIAGTKLGGLARMATSTTGFIIGLTAAIAGLVAIAGMVTFARFEQEMQKSVSIMGDMSNRMRKDMEGTARDVAAATIFSATEAAEAYFFLASAGLDAAQSMAALPVVAQFAQAGNFNLARATDLLTDAQTALGLASADAAENLENLVRIGDVLVKANTTANATVEQFAEALTNKAGASLRRLNKDLEEGVAVLAAFAAQGVKGGLAGERLNIILRDLPVTAQRNATAFSELGIQVFDPLTGSMHNMADIVQQFERALGDLDPQARIMQLSLLGMNQRLADGMSSLIGYSGAIRTSEQTLKDAGGTMEEVSNKQLDTLINQFKLLWGNIKDLALSIGSLLVPALQAMVEWLNKALGPLAKFFRDLRTTNAAIAEMNEFMDHLRVTQNDVWKQLKATSSSLREQRAQQLLLNEVVKRGDQTLANYLGSLASSGDLSLQQLERVVTAYTVSSGRAESLTADLVRRFRTELPESLRHFADSSGDALMALQMLRSILPELFVPEEATEGFRGITAVTLEQLRHLNKIGQVSDSILLARIRQEQSERASSEYWLPDVMALREEEYALIQRMAQAEEQRARQAEQAQERAKRGIDEFMRREVRRLEELNRVGRLTDEQFEQNIRMWASMYGRFTDERIRLEAILEQRKRDAANLENAWMQHNLNTGRMLHEERLQQIEAELEAVKSGSQEELDLLTEKHNLLRQWTSSQIQAARTMSQESEESKLRAIEILEAWREILETMDAGPAVIADLDDAIARMQHSVGQAKDEWADLGNQLAESFIRGMVRGLLDGEMDLKQVVKRVLEQGIVFAIKKYMRIMSPSRVTMEMGLNVSKGLAEGIKQGTNEVAAAWQGVMAGITSPETPALAMAGASGMPSPNFTIQLNGGPGRAKNPLESARDSEWQEFLRESIVVAGQQGFRS